MKLTERLVIICAKKTSFTLVLIQKYPQKMILKVSWIDRNCFCEKRLFQMYLNQSKSTPFKTVYEKLFTSSITFFSCFALVY